MRKRFKNKFLKELSTKDLIKELSKREGVEKSVVPPYEDSQPTVNGPAIVLIITD
ncbi:BC1881 family protein [Halonatronum saccharophilum]|uniref:BC1881 family protein n=1 Tax=Halonatronum saccharophilum TaxID=150060 RepID=UPI0004BA5B24|nr:BC1881 family protein [Halonatronum saccharophilum]